MTAVRYLADLDRMAEHADRVRAFDAVVEQSLAHLDGVVAHLHLSWTGQAATAHAAAHAAWVQAAAAMREAATAMGVAAASARDGYQAAADANLTSWEPLR